jgi:pycsar effector protein
VHENPPARDGANRQNRTSEGRERAIDARAAAGATAPDVHSVRAEEHVVTQKQEFLWKVHSYTNDYIRFADTKAGFCVGIASALIAALFASKSHELFINAFSRKLGGTWSLLAIASLLAFVALGTSIVSSVAAIRPRLWIKSTRGLIFWKEISQYSSAAEFATAYSIQTDLELNERLSNHVYTLATICSRKYFCVNAAIWMAAVGAALAVIVLLFNP